MCRCDRNISQKNWIRSDITVWAYKFHFKRLCCSHMFIWTPWALEVQRNVWITTSCHGCWNGGLKLSTKKFYRVMDVLSRVWWLSLSPWFTWELPKGPVKHIYGWVWASHRYVTLGAMSGPWPSPVWCCSSALLSDCYELNSFALQCPCATKFLHWTQSAMDWIPLKHDSN